MDDAVMKDFFAYGMGAGIPPQTGYFLAELCQRFGSNEGDCLPDPSRLALLIGVYDLETGEVKTDELAAIIAFLREHNFVTVESDGSLTMTAHGSTWWEQAHSAITEETLSSLLHAAGLDRVAAVIERNARSSVRLTAHAADDEDTLPLGVSKLGGSPDVPFDFVWPRYDGFPLAFIAQINLAEVAPHDVERLLPAAGMLYFFFTYEQYVKPENWPQRPDVARVIFHELHGVTLHRTPMPTPLPDRRNCGPYRPCSCTFERELTLSPHLPDLDVSWLRELRERIGPVDDFTEVERNAYEEVIHRLQGPAYNVNRMLGHPDPIQELYLFPDQVLLLQVDSEDELAGMMWGDVGRLYWWMTKDDLARRDFSNVRFDEQCS